MHTCLLPWPPCSIAIAPTCTPIVWVWGPCPSPTWSLPSTCAFAAQPGGPHSPSNFALGCAPTARAKARAIVGRCCVATTTLACNFIWPYNSYVLNHCTSSFSVSPSLALKHVRCKLNQRSSYLNVLAKVSTA
jgi:hypothetical protein